MSNFYIIYSRLLKWDNLHRENDSLVASIPAAVAAVTNEAAVVIELLLFINWNSRDWLFERLQAEALRNDGKSKFIPLSIDVLLIRRCDNSAVIVAVLVDDADNGELCVDIASGRRKTPSWLRQLVCDSTDFGDSADSRYSFDWHNDVGVRRLTASFRSESVTWNFSYSSYFSVLNSILAVCWPLVENNDFFVLASKRKSCSLKLKYL